MEIRVSANPESLESRTACAVEDVVSELRIMNQLTELPGFVLYKDAHLIRGKPVPQIKQAWDAWEEKFEESMFPDPDVFGPTSTFLVIELGDAGRELNDEPMKQIEQVWDVLLGVIIALSRAEATHEFEVCLCSLPSLPLR
jgi:serine/threonine-protein kinase haspin